MRPLPSMAFCCLVLLARVADAHGPTVRVSYKGIVPNQQVVEAGQTIHFQNANSSGAPCTIVAEDGSFFSPALGRAEGFHHTFEQPGNFPYKILEFPGVVGSVLVVEPAG